MVYQYLNQWDGWYLLPLDEEEGIIHTEIPAWSLHRILELLPKKVEYNGWRYNLIVNVGEDLIGYFPPVFGDRRAPFEYFYGNDTIYDDCISTIEWLIKEGYFNKEYLNEHKD